MAADEDNRKQVLQEDWLDEKFMKDEQNEVKRKKLLGIIKN